MLQTSSIGPGILDGLRVLDLTRVVAGPSLTRVLADLGAEVIKVEPPEGDLMRTAWPRKGGIAVMFAGQNVGKRFVSVDLRHAEGVELILRLAEQCDVFVENFRPGVAARLGIGYEQVKARKTDIVYCSVSGYGQEGRASQRRAYAPVVHAESGVMHLKAREWGRDPAGEPISHADIAAGMAGAHGVLAALWRRERTGEGAWVDASMVESMLAQSEWTAVEVNGGPDYLRSPFRPGKAAVVQLGDPDRTWVMIPGSPAAMVVHCLRLSGRADLLQTERFATMEARAADLDGCLEIVAEWAATFDDFETFERTMSEGARIPVGRIAATADTVDTDWAVDRDAYVEAPADNGEVQEPVVVNRAALRIAGTDCGPRSGVRHAGADNAAVFGSLLGLDREALRRLHDAGVLVEKPGR